PLIATQTCFSATRSRSTTSSTASAAARSARHSRSHARAPQGQADRVSDVVAVPAAPTAPARVLKDEPGPGILSARNGGGGVQPPAPTSNLARRARVSLNSECPGDPDKRRRSCEEKASCPRRRTA